MLGVKTVSLNLQAIPNVFISLTRIMTLAFIKKNSILSLFPRKTQCNLSSDNTWNLIISKKRAFHSAKSCSLSKLHNTWGMLLLELNRSQRIIVFFDLVFVFLFLPASAILPWCRRVSRYCQSFNLLRFSVFPTSWTELKCSGLNNWN